MTFFGNHNGHQIRKFNALQGLLSHDAHWLYLVSWTHVLCGEGSHLPGRGGRQDDYFQESSYKINDRVSVWISAWVSGTTVSLSAGGWTSVSSSASPPPAASSCPASSTRPRSPTPTRCPGPGSAGQSDDVC